jgi:hypothetical protein
MPIYLKDVVADPSLIERSLKCERCCTCGLELQETITGKRKMPNGYACSDCYYAELGEEIERHPLASAGIRRG